ncbi:DNA-processing protein DprA [bacterium]|nr:DNA-processing protein DprA [bacterium]MBU1984748.1 DNA-processing protein DprA [bacterium]
MSVVLESESEKTALLNLYSLEGVGSGTLIRLVERFGSAEAVFRQSEAQHQTVPRIPAVVVSRIRAASPDHSTGAQLFSQAAERGIEIRTYWDTNYPPKLRELETDAPAILFIRGTFEADVRRLAVVGTRSATAYGKRVVRDLVLGIRASGIHIVSGLASGIDGSAHEAALEAGLPTEAVFGCGVDRIYPPANTALANRILAAGGGLISEFPLGATPDRHHFPQRNRVIAGLSQGTLVVEAGARSGALITALLAVEYGREVMAVPGAVTNPKAGGCHSLIKNGAALIETADDILQLLEMPQAMAGKAQSVQVPLELSRPESDLMKVLDATEATHIDAIAQSAGMPVGEALGQLLLLELKGAIKQLPGKYFVRA